MNDDIAAHESADAAAHAKARTRALDFVAAQHLRDIFSADTVETTIDLLEGLFMQAWHEGVLAGLDVALARIK